MPGKQGGGPPERTLRESKTALLEAAQAAVADRRAKDRQRRIAWSSKTPARRAIRTTMTTAIMAGAVLLLVRPSWLAGPTLPPETPEIRAASATLALVDAASRVRAYYTATGRLPERLKDAGVGDPTMRYAKVDEENFVLRLAAGDSTVTLKSGDPVKALINDAVRALRSRT